MAATKLGMAVNVRDSAQFAVYFEAETEKWLDVVRLAGVKADEPSIDWRDCEAARRLSALSHIVHGHVCRLDVAAETVSVEQRRPRAVAAASLPRKAARRGRSDASAIAWDS